MLICLQLFLCDKTLLSEDLKVDEVGVACYGRRRLIRAVSVGGRVEGQYLPALCLGFGEEIDKVVSTLAERAYSVRARNRELMGIRIPLLCVNPKFLSDVAIIISYSLLFFVPYYFTIEMLRCQH